MFTASTAALLLLLSSFQPPLSTLSATYNWRCCIVVVAGVVMCAHINHNRQIQNTKSKEKKLNLTANRRKLQKKYDHIRKQICTSVECCKIGGTSHDHNEKDRRWSDDDDHKL